MKIIIKPTEIVEMCVWDDYNYYCMDKDIDIIKFLEDDIEFEMKQNDALVCGILKITECDNIKHRFNNYILDFLSIRSVKVNNSFMIKKPLLIEYITAFKKKFPPTYKPRLQFKFPIEETMIYLEEVLEKIETLKITKSVDRMGTFDYVLSSAVKKCLQKHT